MCEAGPHKIAFGQGKNLVDMMSSAGIKAEDLEGIGLGRNGTIYNLQRLETQLFDLVPQ